MSAPVSTARKLLSRLVSDSPDVTRAVRAGRKEMMRDEGGNSIAAALPLWIAKKVKGKEAVQEALYEKFHRPLKNVDEKAGKFMAETLGTPKLFRQLDVLPTSRRMGGGRALIEHETHSVSAPVTKASKIVTPIAASLYLADKLNPEEEKMAQATETENHDELLKEAADALVYADRERQATKLAYRLVEKGKIPPFQSFAALQEKVAELVTRDLRVVSEAIDLDSPISDFGKVAAADAPVVGGDSAATSFYHRLADNE